ncbi:hypothetical protein [Ahrensia sp. R2A130]|uniref:hypothetical protein n=1 Tax=Ahrensia sp. R2A130 TaxID=744979 RepID=UPI0001E0C301|nr:hypothetical protein [Ahrensia sp. R2A130]EFL90210.1 conserved hypothetical protein [Ahrensia sp. R2A130]
MPKQETTKPRSIRFSDEEWRAIDAKRGKLSASAYVRQCTLDRLGKPRRKISGAPAPHTTQTQLAQIIALLGKSQALSVLRGLLNLARMSALPVTTETENHIKAACDDIRQIKSLLMKALGLKER